MIFSKNLREMEHSGPLKYSILFPENQPKMEQSKLLIVPDYQSRALLHFNRTG